MELTVVPAAGAARVARHCDRSRRTRGDRRAVDREIRVDGDERCERRDGRTGEARSAHRLAGDAADGGGDFHARGRSADRPLHRAARRRRRRSVSIRSKPSRRWARRRSTRGYQVVEYPHIRRRQLEIPAVGEFQGDGRAARAEPERRLRHGLRRRRADGAARPGRHSARCSTPTSWRGAISAATTPSSSAFAPTTAATDLRGNNKRILDYAQNGGTVIVQYNRDGRLGAVRAVSRARQRHARDRRERRSADPRRRRSGVPLSERDWRGGVERLGAGARHLLHRGAGAPITPS